MLDFSAITLADKPLIDPVMQLDGTVSSVRTFTSLFIWGAHYQTCFCMREGILFLKACHNTDTLTYYMPLGGDLPRAIQLIEQDARMLGMPYEITWLTEGGRQAIETAFPGKYRLESQPAEFEYIYMAEDLITLRGKKYHGKRNFINRFLAANSGRWTYEDVDPAADYDEIMAFVRQWCVDRDDQAEQDYHYEYSAIERAFAHYHDLGIEGGILRIDGKVVAFTLASPQNEKAMDILIEKASGDVEGAYQMINHQFATRRCAGYTYINREEDMGIEGLRQAKLSYHPAFLTEKYRAVPVL